MSSRTASRLDPGLIARKGEAAPASSSPASQGVPAQAAAATVKKETPREAPRTGPRGDIAPARGIHGTIAVTVRLDPARYERLKVHGARLRRTNQEIFVEALDGYFRGIAE